MKPVWAHMREWSGVISMLVLMALWLYGALGFASQTAGIRIQKLELTVQGLAEWRRSQDQVSQRLQTWMCVTDYSSAVLAGVPCAQLGVDRLTSRHP